MAAISINLYNNASKDLVVNKTLTPITTLSGTFRTTVDELRPTFIAQGEIAQNVNYAYIAEFGRYYYVTDRKEVSKDLTELSLYVDVRKSFSTQLANAHGIVQRNSQNYNMYLNDNRIPTGARKIVTVRRLGNLFAERGQGVIMLVLGG